MRKITLLFAFLLVALTSFAQVGVTTSPAVPTTADDVILKFDAAGTPLEAEPIVYAHIGLTVDNARWKGVIAGWAVNVEKNTFTNVGGTKHELNLGNLYDYFGIAKSSTISEICLVIRNAKGTSKSENDDVFIPIFKPGLNVQITSPSNSDVFTEGSSKTITADASATAKLSLYINDELIVSKENTNTLSQDVTFSKTGDVVIKVIATVGEQNKEHSINVYVPKATVTETRPTGLKHGITKHENGDITFMLFATNKTGIMVVGDFNDWTFSSDYQMKKDGDYYWLTVPASKLDPNKEYAYQYAIDFAKRFADPYTEKVLDPNMDKWLSQAQYPNLKAYPEGKTTGIVSTFQINETPYSWKATKFKRPDKTNLIIYELHLRDFTTEGTLNAAYQRLDYLAGTGINAIELMPVNEFEGNDSWGYNPSFYFALDKAYGTKNDLKKFIDGCHERGISVILDMVFNHTFGQSPLVQMYDFSYDDGGKTTNNPYYADKHNFKEPNMRFGLKINHESEHSQRWIKDAMSYWINEYKVDGYRLDLTKGFTNKEFPVGDYGSAYTQERVDRLTDYANYVFNTHGSDILFSCEHLSDNLEEKILSNNGLMFWGNLNHSYSQAAMGYASDSDLGWAYYKNRGWTNKNLITYMESHDEERMMYRILNWGAQNGSYNIKNPSIGYKRIELAACFLIPVPGPKLIWQFGELGYDFGIDYCPNGTYNGCRVDRKPIKWEYAENSERSRIRDVFSQLSTIKKMFPGTFNSTKTNLDVSGLGKRINLYDESESDPLHAVIMGNFDTKSKDISPNFPTTGTWYEHFSGKTIDVTEIEKGTLNLAAGEYRLYTNKYLSAPKTNGTYKDNSNVNLYPNPSTDQITFSVDVTSATVYDLTGKKLVHFDKKSINNNFVSVKDLTNGMYLIRISDVNNNETTLRFIKE